MSTAHLKLLLGYMSAFTVLAAFGMSTSGATGAFRMVLQAVALSVATYVALLAWYWFRDGGTIHRVLKRASNFLPPAARINNFEPAYEDAKSDHLLSLRASKSKWQRRWLTLRFNCHAAFLIVDSLRVWLWAKVVDAFHGMVGEG